jgi:nucleotide-binding universal stress UspA family protein
MARANLDLAPGQIGRSSATHPPLEHNGWSGPSLAPLSCMTLPKTILVPTDFGDASQSAVDYAVALARKLGADLVILHTYEIPVVGFPDGAMVVTADLGERILEGAQSGLDKEVARVSTSGLAVRSMIKQGDAWRCILDATDEVGADLIVMGTHGRKGLPRVLIGSVAEKVVRTATVPVLTVHAGEVEDARDTVPEATAPPSKGRVARENGVPSVR